jgi:drug/metabolite transporter (DMT)-like permease
MLCFSGTAPATRVAAPVFGSATLTFGRIAIASVLGAGALVLMHRLNAPPERARAPAILLMGLGLAVGFPLFLALALERVPASHGAVVIGLIPAATAVLSVLRTGERPPPRFWLGCVVGLVAVGAFTISQGHGAPQPADLWLFAAVVSCAVGYVEGGRVAQGIGAIEALCWAMLLLSPLAVAGLAISVITRSFGDLTAGAWAGFLYAGAVSMFLGSVVWYRGLATGGIARIGQLNLAQPLLAVVWSALLLGERISAAVPLTAVVVLAAMALCINSRDRR